MQTGRRPFGSHKPGGRVRLPGLQLDDRVPQLVEGSGREPDWCGFDSHLGHYGIVVQQEDARLARGKSGCESPRFHSRDASSSGLGVCLANRRSGFDSRPFHSVTGLWSNGMTPLWHGGSPGSTPGGSTGQWPVVSDQWPEKTKEHSVLGTPYSVLTTEGSRISVRRAALLTRTAPGR